MNFSEEWDYCYKDNKQMSIWPWSDLVSYFYRYSEKKKNTKVLELGCGAGANIPFFLKLGCEYYAIEGSDFIVKYLKKKFPALKENIFAGDFTEKFPAKKKFDIVIDRASVTHNTTVSIRNCVNLIHGSLKPGGIFIGIDWFSTYHSDFSEGEYIEDRNTKTNFKKGQFTGVGNVHFSDKKHLRELFKNFEILILEHKTINKVIPGSKHVFASWNFAVKKI